MFTNILLAVDGSDSSRHAARKGIDLARALGARLTIVTVSVPWAASFARELAVVVPDIVVPKSEYDVRREAAAAAILHDACAEARCAGVPAKMVHRAAMEPYRAIIEVAEHEHCDLIVVGSPTEVGLAALLMGSEAVRVLTHTRLPVMVCR